MDIPQLLEEMDTEVARLEALDLTTSSSDWHFAKVTAFWAYEIRQRILQPKLDSALRLAQQACEFAVGQWTVELCNLQLHYTHPHGVTHITSYKRRTSPLLLDNITKA